MSSPVKSVKAYLLRTIFFKDTGVSACPEKSTEHGTVIRAARNSLLWAFSKHMYVLLKITWESSQTKSQKTWTVMLLLPTRNFTLKKAKRGIKVKNATKCLTILVLWPSTSELTQVKSHISVHIVTRRLTSLVNWQSTSELTQVKSHISVHNVTRRLTSLVNWQSTSVPIQARSVHNVFGVTP